MFNEMFKEIKPNLVICIPKITYINYNFRAKSIVELTIYSPLPINNNIKKNCIFNCKS